MTAQLHDLADPLQQCGYCAGWQQAELWARIQLMGDEDGGVLLSCRECGYRGKPLAYLGIGGFPHDCNVVHAQSVAELLAVGERHVIEMHA